MTRLMPGDRLTPELVALVAHIAQPLGPRAADLVGQATQATVASFSPTMLDVDVPPDVPPLDLADGPIPSRALVGGAEAPTGELLAWIRAGRFIGLEQAWWTDQPPKDWPAPASVQVS